MLMKTLKYGNETIVIEDESSEGKTGIAIQEHVKKTGQKGLSNLYSAQI